MATMKSMATDEETVAIVRCKSMLQVLGPRDQNVRLIRQELGVRVLAQGDEIRIKGPSGSVQKATEVLEKIKSIVSQNRAVEPEDVHQMIHGKQDAVSGKGEVLPGFNIIQKVRPKTSGQQKYVEAIRNHDLSFCVGPAGTGKTYLAVAMAVAALKQHAVRKIVLVRPAVEAGESLGYLPGDMQAKINPYLRPLLDALGEMMDFHQIKQCTEQDVIEMVPLAYMRGRTLNEAFIILDEAQNTTIPQMKMFLTRMGSGSKIVVCGDASQVDLARGVQNGLDDAVSRLENLDGVSVVRMNGEDVVRHALVQKVIQAYDADSI